MTELEKYVTYLSPKREKECLTGDKLCIYIMCVLVCDVLVTG